MDGKHVQTERKKKEENLKRYRIVRAAHINHNTGARKMSIASNMKRDGTSTEHSATVSVEIEGVTAQALLDTGARMNVMDGNQSYDGPCKLRTGLDRIP